MKKWFLIILSLLLLVGCARSDRETLPPVVVVDRSSENLKRLPEETVLDESSSAEVIEETSEAPPLPQQDFPKRTPRKVRGIYVSAYVAGTTDMMDEIIRQAEETEINTVVIDVKDDEGRITFAMDTPTVTEIGASKRYIRDIEGLIKKLKEKDIYVIARVVAFRDPYLADAKPEWSIKNADGTIYRDNKGLAWVNPYKREVWDYLVEIGKAAGEVGFDEIQFDYIRFSTERGMNNVVFEADDSQGLSKTDIITEFIKYAYTPLKAEGLFVSADVFGAIIGSEEDAGSVGQIYQDMAEHLDYICPMIYPSHYADGNFGIEHPDTKPYETILAALQGSKAALEESGKNGHEVIVRPWLQDFTAKYLIHYIDYGPEEIRAQIQAVYDSGYDEWMLWSASCKYTWDGLEKEE